MLGGSGASTLALASPIVAEGPKLALATGAHAPIARASLSAIGHQGDRPELGRGPTP